MHQRVLDRASRSTARSDVNDTPWPHVAPGALVRIADGPDEVHKMVIALRELNRFKPREPGLAQAAGSAGRAATLSK